MPPPHRLEGGQQGVPERPNPLRRRSSLGPRGVREIAPPSLMATSWAMARRYRGLFTRIETEQPVARVHVYILNFWVLPRVLSNMRCLSGLPVPLETGSFEDSVTSEALQLFLSRMVTRGGEYRWSCEKLNGGLGRVQKKLQFSILFYIHKSLKEDFGKELSLI